MASENMLRKRFYHTQKINSGPEKIFPLLCPVREYEWIEHWKCKMIYSDSGYAEENCVFITESDEGGEDIWKVSKYNPPLEIQFVRTNKLRVIRYNISLKQNNNDTTTVEWEQTITALNHEGAVYTEKLIEDDFKAMIGSLEQMLNYFLQTGKMLKHEK